ncbi:MAG TPA: DNA recombination protein RmuC [Actinomycetes bacterium]|nr:DNA recombination protein RmuC [Actinomycetes bacterium]
MDISSVVVFVGLVLLAAIAGAGGATWLIGRRAQPAGRRGGSDHHASMTTSSDADPVLAPVTAALQRVEQQLAITERHRAEAHGQLQEQVRAMNEASQLLRGEASLLVQALRAPHTRGRWGELQLRRVVELAGLVEHCDFTEQMTVTSADGYQRPDLVVHLAGGKNIVVDSKVSIAAYLEMTAASDQVVASERQAAHARHLRTHIDQLARREYWESLTPSPEFVVLFVPAEPFLAAALEGDPTLLEYAFEQNVVLATPNTLIALLRTVAYTWRQDALSQNAQAVLDTGRELHQRLGTMSTHLARVGAQLEGSVKAYNSLVGSLETRVLVTARRFNDLKVSDHTVAAPESIDLAPRVPRAEELTDPHDRPDPYPDDTETRGEAG